jgi:hypothetical protein
MSDKENILDLYDKLLEYDDDDKKERLAFVPKQKGKSKSFCMAPWITIYAQPDKGVRLCCAVDGNIGSLKENTLKEIWNSDEMKKSRLAMLKGEKVDACHRCYEQEESGVDSFRISLNRQMFQHYDEMIPMTTEDGTVDKFNIKYFDIRFSNLCNFSCRSCSHMLSSGWYEDAKKIGDLYGDSKVLHIDDETNVIFDEIYPMIPDIETFYFAGGEALFQEEHYKILKRIIELEKFDAKIFYATNFSKITYKDMNFIDMWKQIKTPISMGVSYDAMGKRGEYMRKGQDWEKSIEHVKLFVKECPDHHLHIIPTLSIFNVFDLPDMHKFMVEECGVRVDYIYINMLTAPDIYRVHVLPKEFKEKLKKKYIDHIEWIRKGHEEGKFEYVDYVIRQFNHAIEYVMKEDYTSYLKEFYERTRYLDKIRGERFEEVFTEYKDLKNYIK